MSKERPTIGINGLPLPVMPPDRDARVWARMVRVMFYTPGFLALLLIKAGEPASFGITVSLFMLTSATAIIGGLFIGTQSTGGGADTSSKIGVWSGALVLELLAAVPLICAIPPLFHALAHSALLHGAAPGSVPTTIGASELLPAMAVLPFMLYQLAGFGTLHYIVSTTTNWLINIGILVLIICNYVANHMGAYAAERIFAATLVCGMTFLTFYGILTLRKMQAAYDANCPRKEEKEKRKEDKEKSQPAPDGG